MAQALPKKRMGETHRRDNSLNSGIGGLIEDIYYYSDDDKQQATVEDLLEDTSSNKILQEEDVLYYYDDPNVGQEVLEENDYYYEEEVDVVITDESGAIEDEEIYYYDEEVDVITSSEPQNQGVVEGGESVTTGTSQGIVEEEDEYYYYKEEEDTIANQNSQIPDKSVDAAVDEGDNVSEVIEEDDYYYYMHEETDQPPNDVNSTGVSNSESEDTPETAPPNSGSGNEEDSIANGEDAIIVPDPENEVAGEGKPSEDENASVENKGEEFSPMVWECPGFLLKAKKTYSRDVKFTFAAEFWGDIVDDLIRKVNIELLPHVAKATLFCEFDDDRRLAGIRNLSASNGNIFLLRFRDNGIVSKVSECQRHAVGNTCNVFSGKLLLVSDKMISDQEQKIAARSVESYIDGMEMKDSKNSGIYYSEYLGPDWGSDSMPSKTNGMDRAAIAFSVTFLVTSLVFLAYRHYSRKRRVRFNLVPSIA